MYKIRFNLGRGENYKKWKITEGKNVKYYEPSEVNLVIYGGTLKNNKTSALKIFNGSNKFVCAWILCNHYEVKENVDITNYQEICYNPKLNPYWTSDNKNIDDYQFEKIVTKNNKVYAK